MFRRSFQVFLATALLALAATLLFVFLRLRGPEEALGEAQACLDRGEFSRAVYLLNLAGSSTSLQRDPSKRARLWRLRYTANNRLDNAAGALEDLEMLLQTGVEDQELQLDRIRLLAVLGRGEPALRFAREFLAAHPDDWRGLELAGEAMQTTYREELANVFAAVERDLGLVQRIAGRQALLAFLYRPDGDAEVAQGIEELRRRYGAEARLAPGWPALLHRLQDLRARIQEGQRWWQRSLEAGGEPVAAMRGLALSLDQSSRTDDLLALCEGYRLRYDHQYVVEAGAQAAWALLRAGLDEAALATTLRWLPPGAVDRAAAGRPNPALADLLHARWFAAHRLGDAPALGALVADLKKLKDAGQPVDLPMLIASAEQQVRNKGWQYADNTLRGAAWQLVRTSVPIGQIDAFPDVVALRRQFLEAKLAPPADHLALFTEWARVRPGELAPLLAQARFQREQGNAAAALAVLADAASLQPDDESIFAEQVAAADSLYEASNQNGLGLLAQCRNRKTLLPEVANPIGFVLCAQAALDAGVAEVARESANAAIDKFPAQMLPRVLRARADLLGGRAEDAAQQLQQLLVDHPDDGELAALALRARRMTGTTPGPLLATTLRTAAPSAEIAAELLRSALADDRENAATFVPDQLPAVDTELGQELRVLVARALVRAGRRAEAEPLVETLAAAAPTAPPARRRELAEVCVDLLLAAADGTKDLDLQRQAEGRIVSLALDDSAAVAPLLRGGETLATTHPATANVLVTTALAAAEPEQRTGAALLLAGRIDAHLGHFAQAIDHWTAAVSFPDGRAAAEPLARLNLAEEHPDRAALVYRLVETPTDAALAARCGDPARAKLLAKEARERDGADLLAHVVAACLGEPSSVPDFGGLDEPGRAAVLELASLLADHDLTELAVIRAQKFAASFPQCPTGRLLLARGLAAGGDANTAASTHAGLFAQKATGPLFWREIALCADRPGYVVPPAQLEALAVATARNEVLDSPVVVAFGMRETAAVIARAGNQGIADQMHATMWIRFPVETRPTVDDAAGLAARGRKVDAFWVYDKVRPTLRGGARVACVSSMAELADELLRAKAPEGESLYATLAQRVLEEGPDGALVRVLLDHGARFPALRPDPAAAQALLIAQLQAAAAGHDAPGQVRAAAERLAAVAGLDVAAEAVAKALAAHPTSLETWTVRTTLEARRQRGAEAVAALRTVLAHGSDPADRLTLVTLAATHLALQRADVVMLDRLPAPLLQTPEGQLARGLVALRRGKPGEARGALAAAAPRPDGLHLYAQSLAALQAGGPEALRTAAAGFRKLAADYPSSSLARYAGSFVRQFSPR